MAERAAFETRQQAGLAALFAIAHDANVGRDA
jgi:hypothetical protein